MFNHSKPGYGVTKEESGDLLRTSAAEVHKPSLLASPWVWLTAHDMVSVSLSGLGLLMRVTSYHLVPGERPCCRDTIKWGLLLYWWSFSEQENDPGSYSKEYHFSMEEKGSGNIDHFWSYVIFGKSSRIFFFSTVTFETGGYIPYTNENNRWQSDHCSFHRYMIRKGFFDQKKQLIEMWSGEPASGIKWVFLWCHVRDLLGCFCIRS